MTFGIAKANATIENYIKLVANSDKNLKALLDWKSKKEKWEVLIKNNDDLIILSR